jgi:hypothetical protein
MLKSLQAFDVDIFLLSVRISWEGIKCMNSSFAQSLIKFVVFAVDADFRTRQK